MMQKEVDIAISDEQSSTVIHVRGPGNARMCDVGCVFDKLGVDVISCSTMPSSSSCDMILVVDRHDSQPLDSSTKASVTEGLQRVFSAHRNCSTDSSTSMSGTSQASPPHQLGCSGGSACPQASGSQGSTERDAASGVPSWPGSRDAAMDVCRADSASESIPISKSSSLQLSPSVTGVLEQQLHQHPQQQQASRSPSSILQIGSSSASPCSQAAGAGAGSQLSRGSSGSQQVRFNPVCITNSAADSPAIPAMWHVQQQVGPQRPALTIDIPSDNEAASRSCSSQRQQTSSTSGSEMNQQMTAEAASGAGDWVECHLQQQGMQQSSVQVQDLARRLMELGMLRQPSTGMGSSSSSEADFDGGGEDDEQLVIRCRSGGSSSSAGGSGMQRPCRWQPLSGKSCGDLLLLARQQQVARIQRSSDAGMAPSGTGSGTVAGAGAAAAAEQSPQQQEQQLQQQQQQLPPDPCGSGTFSTGDQQPQRGDSSRSLSSLDDGQQAGRWAANRSPAAGIAIPATSAGSSGRRRRPPPRTPSRIILSPVAPDGTADPSGQPRLFVSIPKAPQDERRSKRTAGSQSSASQSCAATPRVPFTPVSAVALTPSSGGCRSGNTLKQLSSSLVSKRGTGHMSPTAVAAAAATAAMPYNVAVAAAQLLSNNTSAREAAAAMVAAAAAAESDKGDSSAPLPSPVHPPVGAAAAGSPFAAADDNSGPLSPISPVAGMLHRTSSHFQTPPATPVHPSVAACAAAYIVQLAAVDAAAGAQSQAVGGDISDSDEQPLRLPLSIAPLGPLGAASAADAVDAVAASAAAAPPATIMEVSAEEEEVGERGDMCSDGSSSEEWWCGELTGMNVADIMTRPVKAITADADVAQARQLMVQLNLPGMLVDTGPGQQPGFLTRGDFFKASIIKRRGSRKRPHKPCVRDIMGPVLVVHADMPIEECAQAMQEAGVRHAAVRDDSPAATTPAEPSVAPDPMAMYVGLVSDAAIYRCLGLYPAESTGQDELLEEGLLGLSDALRVHSGLDSSYDSSGGGTDTPLSNRSRVATPLVDRAPEGPPPLLHQHQHEQQGQPQPQQQQHRQRQQDVMTLPDIVLLREGRGGASSSAASSMGSVGSAAAAADGGQKADGSSSDGPVRSGTLALALAPSSTGAEGALSSRAESSSSNPPDALTRFKNAAALWEIDMSELEMIKRIGEGSFGEVMLASYRGTKVAVKRLHVLDLDDVAAPNEQRAAACGSDGSMHSSSTGGRPMGASQAAFRQFFEREIAILASIRHPNVVNFIGACHKPGQRCLVTEYCARGSLDQVLHKSGLALDLAKRIEFAMDVARGMACLHAQRPIIIHRDLKTANLLVSARFEVKVADFGLSRIKDASHLQVSRAGLEGTIEYCAPEVLRGEPYTERCDVYSFGVVLWELLLRQRPYSDAEVPVFLLMVNIGNGSLALPEVPLEAATPGLVDLLQRCLAFSPADRPEFREVLALLEAEYRALRARQPPRHPQQQQQAQPQPQLNPAAAAVLRCDSASSLAVHQSPRITTDSPDAGDTPNLQSPAGSHGCPNGVAPALAGANAGNYSSAAAASAAGAAGNQEQYGMMPQEVRHPGPQWFNQQQQQRHRLSQHDSLTLQPAASAGSGTAQVVSGQGLCGVNAPSAPLYQLPVQQYQVQCSQQQQQHLHSMPLPQLVIPQQQQHALLSSHPSSPRHQQQQQFLGPPGQPVRVLSAFGAANLAGPMQQQQQQQHYHQHAPGGLTPPAGPSAGSSSSKPPRHKHQLSRARSMPAPESAWELDGEEGDGTDGEGELGGNADILLFAEDSFGAMSSYSNTGYSPCPSGQLCMLVEPSASFNGSGMGGSVTYQQQQQQAQAVYLAPSQQQQVLVMPQGQQVVPVQPVLIQQPGGQVQQAFIQQHYQAAPPLQPAQQQQPQQQQAARVLHRGLGTPSPTPAVLARAGTPLSSSPSPGLNPLAIMAAAGAAAAAARREGSASGAVSPRQQCGSAGVASGGGSSTCNSGSQEMPPLHLLQIGDCSRSQPGSPQRGAMLPNRFERPGSDSGAAPATPAAFASSGGGSAAGYQHQAPAGAPLVVGSPAIAAPLLLQRLDSLHRSGSSSPRCLHRAGSPGLQTDHSGQLLGLLVPGYCSGPPSGANSPRSLGQSPRSFTHVHTPPAVAAVHLLHRPGSSRLAIQGSYELPPGGSAVAAAAAETSGSFGSAAAAAGVGGAVTSAGSTSVLAGASGPSGTYVESAQALPVFGLGLGHAPGVHMYHHQFPQMHQPGLPPGSRRAPSLLRIDSNSRDRALSPFALASGAGGEGSFSTGGVHPGTAGAAAPQQGTVIGSSLSPFAAAATRSIEDAASGADCRTVQPAAAGAAAGQAADNGAGSTPPPGVSAGRRYVSPFAAASRQEEEDGDEGDTDAVFDTSARSSRAASPAAGERSSKQQPCPPQAGNKSISSPRVRGTGAQVAAVMAASPRGAVAGSASRPLASPFALMQQVPPADD